MLYVYYKNGMLLKKNCGKFYSLKKKKKIEFILKIINNVVNLIVL